MRGVRDNDEGHNLVVLCVDRVMGVVFAGDDCLDAGGEIDIGGDLAEPGHLVAKESPMAEEAGVDHEIVATHHGAEDVAAVLFSCGRGPEADLRNVLGIVGKSTRASIVLEHLCDVVADGPVVIGLDGDMVVGLVQGWRERGAHGPDKLFVDEFGDQVNVGFVLVEAHAGDDL